MIFWNDIGFMGTLVELFKWVRGINNGGILKGTGWINSDSR